MEPSSCPICGRPTARGSRYCAACGGAAEPAEGAAGQGQAELGPKAHRTGGRRSGRQVDCRWCGRSVPKGARVCSHCKGRRPAAAWRDHMRLFCVATGLIAVLGTALGMAAPRALPFLTRELGLAQPVPVQVESWGEIRYIHVTTNIRAGPGTGNPVVDQLVPGDSVRTDFAQGNWLAVFSPDQTMRKKNEARGYVYAPLLEKEPPGTLR